MSVRNLFDKPLHFEYSLGLFCLWKLLRLYALLRQLSLVGKELAGEKKVVTSLARKDDENYKKTLALLKPYLTSAAYHKTLEYSRDKLYFDFFQELFRLVVNVVAALNCSSLKLWHLSRKLYNHPCVYSQVFLYLSLRVAASLLYRLPFRYFYRYAVQRKHGLKSRTTLSFFGKFLFLYLLLVTPLTVLLSALTYLDKNFRRDFLVNAVPLLSACLLLMYPLLALLFSVFHTLSPVEDPELKKEVDAMARKVGLSPHHVKVVPSKQVSDLVTFSWGFGKTKWLYLNESYVNLGKPSALALVAYALGHFKHHHPLKFYLSRFFELTLFLVLFQHYRGYTVLFKSLGSHSVNSLVFRLDNFAAFLYVYFGVCNVLRNVMRHYFFSVSDKYAVKLGHSDELVNVWTTVYRERKWFFNVDPLYGPLFNVPPSLFERVYSVFDATPRATAN